jgi:hypothetical protein
MSAEREKPHLGGLSPNAISDLHRQNIGSSRTMGFVRIETNSAFMTTGACVVAAGQGSPTWDRSHLIVQWGAEEGKAEECKIDRPSFCLPIDSFVSQ